MYRFVKEYANFRKKEYKAIYKAYKNPDILQAIERIDHILRTLERGFITTDEAMWLISEPLLG